jgi:hypothetical protein
VPELTECSHRAVSFEAVRQVGDPVLLRERIWYAASMIAVRDDPDALVLWQPREAAHVKPIGEIFGDLGAPGGLTR